MSYLCGKTVIIFLRYISEQQHVQTNLKATFAGVSVLFSFYDEDQKDSCDWTNVGSNFHYVGAECRDISLVVQVINVRLKNYPALSYFVVFPLNLVLYMIFLLY